MNEKGWENFIKDGFKKWWKPSKCIKIASGWMGGIPDLYMVPTWAERSAWCELKFVRMSEAQGPTKYAELPEKFELKLTGQQRTFIEKEQLAGGVAGWSVLVQLSEFDSVALSGTDHTCTEIDTRVLLEAGLHGRMYQRTEAELRKHLERIYRK